MNPIASLVPTPPLLEIISIPGLELDFSTLQPAVHSYHQQNLTASRHKLYSTSIQLFLSFHHSIWLIIPCTHIRIDITAGCYTHLHASVILLMLHLIWIEDNNHYNNISLLPLGGKTPVIKTPLSMICEFSWLYSLQNTSPQKFKLPPS